MNGWLVDTHVLLWFWNEPEKLSETAMEVLEDPRASLIISAVSIWEIAVKEAVGKLKSPPSYPAIIEAQGYVTLPIEPAHALAVSRLPLGDHRDPFDRMLVAQAKSEVLPIISADERLDQYKIARLW